MTTLREAAEQALEAMTSRDGDSWTRRFARDRAIEALEAALAEPVPTLVAWRITDGEGDWEYRTDLPEDWSIKWSARYGRRYEPLYSAPIQRKPLSVTDLQEALVYANLIDRDAIDDPDNYDEGSTLAQIDVLHRAIKLAHGIGGDA